MSKTVYIESDLSELIPVFLDNRCSDITKALNALENQDFAFIIRLGHNLKGIGTSYGFDYISELGKKIEEAAKIENCDYIVELLNQLKDYVTTVKIEYI